MTPEELKEIEERCNKSTPRPWFVFSDDLIMRAVGVRGVFCRKHGLLRDHKLFEPVKATREDEIFVAFAQKDIPDLLAHIKELESQAIRWIPVGEKLPEIKGDAFLAYDCDEESMWIESSTRFMTWNNVTHWAELPAPPKEESC